MSRKRRRRHRPATTPAPASPGDKAPRADHPRHHLLADLVKGLVLIALVLSVKLAVEHTTFGRQLEIMSYNLLQLRLKPGPVPVAIVDISDLEPEAFEVGGITGKATPRATLRELIEAIASQHPRAIGVDIDFSPDQDGYIYPGDPEFFDFCLALEARTGVRVLLGIGRSVTRPESERLGSPKYTSLAANLIIPRDSRRMVDVIRIGDGEESASKAMSVAIAESFGERPAGGWWSDLHGYAIAWLRRVGMIERFAERRLGAGIAVEDFLIDFSPLESIQPIRTIDPAILRDSAQRPRLEGKLVLLGDATLGRATDLFQVPGRLEPVPGVFLHASAAYTLVKGPLYEVTHWGRLCLDVAFSLAILLAVLLIRRRFGNRAPQAIASVSLQGVLTLVVVIAAIIVGVWFVRSTRIMWDDFLLALTALMFHPSVERVVDAFLAAIRQRLPRRQQRLAVGAPKEGHQ